MTKNVTFLPNTIEAENPFPRPFMPLLVNDRNNWFPSEYIVGGILFPLMKVGRK